MKKRIKKKIHKYVKKYIEENNMVRLCDVNRPIVALHYPSLKIGSRIEISAHEMMFFEQPSNKHHKDKFLEYQKEEILHSFIKNEDFRKCVVYTEPKIDNHTGNCVITGTIEIYNPNAQ